MKTDNIKAVICSLDGLIFNTHTLQKQIFSEILESHHLEIFDYFFELYIDGGYQQRHRAFIHYPKYAPYREEMEAKYLEALKQGIENKSLFNSDFVKLYDWIKNNQLKLGLVSSVNDELGKSLLASAAFDIEYDYAVFSNQVIEAKPEKNQYSKLAKKLGVLSKECLVMESSVNGILGSYLADMNNVYIENFTLRVERTQKYSQLQCPSISRFLNSLV